MDNQIVTATSNLPRLKPGSIERTHLLARLAQARHKTCILVLGPAGSGKTSLALQWRAKALAFGYDVAWLTAQPGDDGQALMNPLFTALDRIDADIAREARLLYNRGRSMDAIAIALLRGFLARSRPLVLVLDDWQNVGDASIHHVMQTLLDFASPSLRLLIVSRSVPSLSLARLRDQGALMEIGPLDLRFTLEEVEAFVQVALPRPHLATEARRLLELTDGWAAGLQLMALNPGGSAAPVQNAHDFAAYFNREVLRHLDEASLDIITRLAAARGFNPALVVALAGEEAGHALLERLRSEHLFVTSLDGVEREGWQCFHPLFRELLLERFERLPREERERVHTLLAQWFGRHRLLHEAVHHGVAAGDLQQAVEWVDRWARELFLNGELQQLVRAVAELPRTILNTRPSLLLWVGWAQLCYRQFMACHKTLAALRAQLREDDQQGRAHSALLAFSLALQEDDLRTAQRLLPFMETMRHGSDAVLAGGRRNLMGWMYAHMGEYAQARAVLQGAPPLREDGLPLLDSAFGQIMNESLQGFAWLYEGNVRQADPLLREALAKAERVLGRYSEPACNAAACLSAVLYEVNDLGALRQLLDGRLDTMQRVVLPDALITVSLASARLRCFEGNFLEALEGLERLEDITQQRSLDRLVALSLGERVRCLLRLGDLAAARQVLHQLQVLAARQACDDSPVCLRVRGAARYAQALLLAASHDDRAALEALGDPGRYDTPLLQRRDRCAAQALRAILLARVGQRSVALQALHDTLLQAQQYGLVRSMLDLGDELLALAVECAQGDGQVDPVLGFYVDHLSQQATLHRAGAQQSVKTLREPLSERELEILRALAHSMSNKRIALVLGVSPETVKWHLRNVYTKLGVAGRDDAVARARDLGLIHRHEESET